MRPSNYNREQNAYLVECLKKNPGNLRKGMRMFLERYPQFTSNSKRFYARKRTRRTYEVVEVDFPERNVQAHWEYMRKQMNKRKIGILRVITAKGSALTNYKNKAILMQPRNHYLMNTFFEGIGNQVEPIED